MANPQIEIIQLDNLTDPSGTRDQGASTDGYVSHLDTTATGVLDFGAMNTTTSGVFSSTKLFYFRPTSLGDANEIYNFRFWLNSVSAWDSGNYIFKWENQQAFEGSKELDATKMGVPTSLPDSQNVYSTQSGTYIQSTAESGCSEYVYLNIFVDTDVPVGNYGGAGNGGFRYRITYDFS